MKTTLGERLDIFLKNKRITQQELMDIIKRSQSDISGYINNKRKPQIEILEKLLLKFPDLDARWLLIGEIHTTNLANDGVTPYYGKCAECAKKDKIIEDMIEDKKIFKKMLDECLKKLDPEEKRKAG